MSKTPKETAVAFGDLIRKNDQAAEATGDAQAIAAAKALHVFAYHAAHHHAELIGIDTTNADDMAALSGGTPKGDPPPPPTP